MKRPLVASTAILAAVGLTSCNAVESTSAAAQVADRVVTVDEFQAVMQGLASTGAGDPEDPATGTIPGTTARQYLSVIVQGEVNEVFLADHGEQITDADRAQATASVTIPAGLPADVTRRIQDASAARPVRARVAAPSDAELKRAYDARPSDLGVVCTRQIVLATEAEAQAVIDAIDAGGSFADQVARSIDTTSKAKGGAVEADSGACIPGYSTALDRAIVTALADAGPGEVVGPVRTEAGWHVLQQRPYSEVADSIHALFAQSAGDLLYWGYLLHTDVTIDPRYGRWDAANAAVVPLSGP